MPRVYISHSREDRDFAIKLRHLLENAGVDSFISEIDISRGMMRWTDITREALEKSDALIVLVSKSPSKSNWVLFEVGAAWGQGKRIIPLLLPGTDFKDIPQMLQEFQVLPVKSENEAQRAVELITHSL